MRHQVKVCISASGGVSVAEANYLDMYAVPKDTLLSLEYLMFTWFLQKHGTTHNAFVSHVN